MSGIPLILLSAALLWTASVSAGGPTYDGKAGPICGPILSLFGVAFNGPRTGFGSRYPTFRATPAREVPIIKLMSASNGSGLDPIKLPNVPLLRQQMLDGTFDYAKTENRISGGFHETTETYLLQEGHHRVLAALQIAAETGNWGPFKLLIDHGAWPHIDSPAFSGVVKALPVQRFAVSREREGEMDRILKSMQVPTVLRMFWNTEWMR